jgi:hypothetical protein
MQSLDRKRKKRSVPYTTSISPFSPSWSGKYPINKMDKWIYNLYRPIVNFEVGLYFEFITLANFPTSISSRGIVACSHFLLS